MIMTRLANNSGDNYQALNSSKKKLFRTELSYEKLPVYRRTETSGSKGHNLQSNKSSRSLPKVQYSRKRIKKNERIAPNNVQQEYFVQVNSKPETTKIRNIKIIQESGQKKVEYFPNQRVQVISSYYRQKSHPASILSGKNNNQPLPLMDEKAQNYYTAVPIKVDASNKNSIVNINSSSRVSRNSKKIENEDLKNKQIHSSHYYDVNPLQLSKNNIQRNINQSHDSIQQKFSDKNFQNNGEKFSRIKDKNSNIKYYYQQVYENISKINEKYDQKQQTKERDNKSKISLKRSQILSQNSKKKEKNPLFSKDKLQEDYINQIPALDLGKLQNKVNRPNINDTIESQDKLRRSLKNLPLSSREASRHFTMQNSIRPMRNCIEEVLQRVQIHDYILALFNNYIQEMPKHFVQPSQKAQLVRFLLEKKYFYEKTNLIKALKGGKNVFQLSTVQIPDDYLKQHINHPDIKMICKENQEKNRNLFKSMQTTYRQILPRHRQNPQVKLETPNDNFTSELAVLLYEHLLRLYDYMIQHENDNENLVIETQDKIIDTMQLIFILSELQSRKVKKLQFSEQIEDFEQYYQQNLELLNQTMQYFEAKNKKNNNFSQKKK